MFSILEFLLLYIQNMAPAHMITKMNEMIKVIFAADIFTPFLFLLSDQCSLGALVTINRLAHVK